MASSLSGAGRVAPAGPAGTLAIVLGGSIIAAGMTALMYNTPWVWSFLVMGGLAVFAGMFLVRDVERYWLWLFLFLIAFDIKKNLLDGLKIRETLGLEGQVPLLVPDVRLTDLVLWPLFVIWIVRLCLGRSRLRLPHSIFFFAGYVFWAALSGFRARHPYLTGVYIYQELRGAIIFLYVVNNIDFKRWMPVVKSAILAALALQGGLTLVRYRFQYFANIGGDSFGRMTIDTNESEELLIDKGVGSAYRPTGAKRGFGTMTSPAGTSRFMMLLLPTPLFWAFRSTRPKQRMFYLFIFLLGTGGLLATFSRAGIVGLAVEVVLTLWLASRLGFLPTRTFHMIGIGIAGAALVASPILSIYLLTRPANVSIRMTQYAGALRMIMANPILGVGLNNSTETMRAYTLSTTGPATTPNKVVYRQPIHSYFLSITAEVGLVGAALLLGFFISNCRAAFRLTRSGNPDEAFYAAVAVVSIIGLGTQLAADPMADIPVIVLLWFFCGFIAGLAMARFPRLTGPLVPAAPQGG